MSKNSDTYDMSFRQPSKFLIISNEHFEQKRFSDRTGTEADVDRLRGTFSKFGFDIVIHRNLTTEQMKSTINDAAQEDHSKRDCMGLAILTHGGQNPKGDSILYGTDGSPVEIDDLVEPLRKRRFGFGLHSKSTLVGKPKLIFIQACPGPMNTDGQCENAGQLETESDESMKCIPLGKDLLFQYSTANGYQAWRSDSSGTVYIQSLCDVLEENEHGKLELITQLTRVNGKVVDEYEKQSSPSDDQELKVYRMQHPMPAICSQLRGNIFLKSQGQDQPQCDDKKAVKTNSNRILSRLHKMPRHRSN